MHQDRFDHCTALCGWNPAELLLQDGGDEDGVVGAHGEVFQEVPLREERDRT
jgi:hypothetical protein